MPTSAFFDDQDALADVGIRAPGCEGDGGSVDWASCESEPGKGALFVVQLPAGTASAKLLQIHDANRILQTELKPKARSRTGLPDLCRHTSRCASHPQAVGVLIRNW